MGAVKRLLALLLGGLGLRALLRRRSVAPPLSASPAEGLRAKLAETRTEDEAVVPAPEEPEPGVDGRRADVHARARQAIDELKGER
jgi:hypothetical protein